MNRAQAASVQDFALALKLTDDGPQFRRHRMNQEHHPWSITLAIATRRKTP